MKRANVVAAAAGGALLLGALLIAAAGDLARPGPPPLRAAPGAAPASAPQGLETVSLKVDNLFCVACRTILRRALEDVDGVEKAEVFYDSKTAVVTYDPARCDAKDLIAATAGIGFPSSVIERVRRGG